jgi:hypothetical protein
MELIRKALVALCAACAPLVVQAAATVDVITQGANKVNSSTNDTIAHTSGGSANCGIVAVGYNDVTLDERTSAGVTWGGVAMSAMPDAELFDFDEGRVSVEFWVLDNPATGAQNVVIDPGGAGATTFQGWSFSLNGADCTDTAFVDFNCVDEATPSDVPVSSVADGLVIDFANFRSATAIDADASQSNEQLSTTLYGISTKAGTGSTVTMTWTFTSASADRAHCALSLAPSVGGSSSVVPIINYNQRLLSH